MKHYLKYPDNYDAVLARTYNNGCGPAGWKGKLVPDTIYGISIREACKIHDYMYEVGESYNDKVYADDMFFTNLLATVENEAKWWNRWLNTLRRKRAWIYFKAVVHGGEDAFNDKVRDNETNEPG